MAEYRVPDLNPNLFIFVLCLPGQALKPGLFLFLQCAGSVRSGDTLVMALRSGCVIIINRPAVLMISKP